MGHNILRYRMMIHMRPKFHTQILFLLVLFLLLSLLGACGSTDSSTDNSTRTDTPTEAYKRLYAAVKQGETEAIKQEVTQKTISLAEMSAKQFNKSVESRFEIGFTATTYSNTLPSIRDERVSGNMGAIEVWNAKESKWEDLPYIFEDGKWKLAMGDVFAGTYQSPAKGQFLREKEAANLISNSTVISPGNNANLPANKGSNRK